MSSFALPPPNESVSVKVPDHAELSSSELLSFPAFKTWLNTLTHSLSLQSKSSHPFNESPYKLKSIDIQSIDRFGKRLGFVKLKAQVETDDGESLPGSIFLRGGAVAMMVILKPDDAKDSTEKYVLLTRQPRIPAGSLDFQELPAGMLDDSGTFAGAAAKEIEEELGLTIPEDELLDLTQLASQPLANAQDNGEKLQQAAYSSPGGSDEFLALFLHEREVSRSSIDEWKGKLTGLRDHGEKITLKTQKH